MERKKSALTPESYTRAIISLSRRYPGVSTFPGSNYLDIAEWMLQDQSLFSSATSEEYSGKLTSTSEESHDLVVVYNSGNKNWDVKQYSQEQHEAFSTATSAPAEGLGQLVFIRGFISPSWISAIGSKYNIDPEYFRRHLEFLSVSSDRHSFSSPSLDSASNNMFRLCVSTIIHRDDFGRKDLESQQSYLSTAFERYKIQQLSCTRVCCGDSIVRQYSTVCSCFSVIEQWISICITKTDKNWAVIAWMDQGRPLEKSPTGPWTIHLKSKATPLPVLQHHPKMAFRTTTNCLDPSANISAEFQQSTTVLPLQYDSLIALVDLARRAPQDPLSMCIPLFAHAAFSEVQFLNLMESKIQMRMNKVTEGVSADALGAFQYFFNILSRHSRQLLDSTRALYKLAERSNQGQNGGSIEDLVSKTTQPPSLGPHTHGQTSASKTARSIGCNSSESSFTTKSILEDYEQLHTRCVELSKLCTRGITLAMNKATIDESRKAIEQSERLKKLTVLATLFIPLNFTSSLMGMNIDLLEQNAVKFWWFFVLCVPFTLFAYAFYLWDFRALKRCWMKLRKGCHAVRQDTTLGRSDKDAGHIV